MPDGGPVTSIGQIDVQVMPPGETFTGNFQLTYNVPTIHTLPQPLFRAMDALHPSLQWTLATDHTWQAQLGWTLLKRQWLVLGERLEFSLQQSIGRQFGDSSAERAFIANLLQGQLQTQPDRSGVYLFAQGTWFGRRTDENTFVTGFQATIGCGWQFDIHVPRR